ncbi:hypothetical protein HY478_02185 [Candidatus Uhrbacteria bacterium]|nr:hypothetical protein [Candidatus Uhrbacteria bacterium]
MPPSVGKPKGPEPVIHVMPGEYYGVPPKTPLKKDAPLPPLPPKPPQPKPAPPPKPGAPQKKKVPVLLIVGIAFLVVIGVGGFFFLQSLKPKSPPQVAINVTPPTPLPPVNVAPPPPPPPLPPAPIRPGIDTDSDGLTDVEETTIYNSNPRNPDTDGDSFIDGNEVFHLYDPTRGANATLADSPAMQEFVNTDATVSLLMPKAWLERQTPHPSGFEFSIAPDGSSISLDFTTQEASEIAASDPASTFGPFTSKGGYEGLRSTDRRKVILDLPVIGVSVSYDLGSGRTIEFLRTFEMIVNSVRAL